MSLVKENAVDDAFDGLVDRGIRENDISRLAAEFQRVFLAASGNGALYDAPDFRRAGKRYLVDVLVIDDCGTRLTGAGDDVDDPRRQVSILDDFCQLHRRQWRRFRRLQHHGIAACQRRRNLPGSHQQRKVPRNHLARDTE